MEQTMWAIATAKRTLNEEGRLSVLPVASSEIAETSAISLEI